MLLPLDSKETFLYLYLASKIMGTWYYLQPLPSALNMDQFDDNRHQTALAKTAVTVSWWPLHHQIGDASIGDLVKIG
jgi:hypothetical protein